MKRKVSKVYKYCLWYWNLRGTYERKDYRLEKTQPCLLCEKVIRNAQIRLVVS